MLCGSVCDADICCFCRVCRLMLSARCLNTLATLHSSCPSFLFSGLISSSVRPGVTLSFIRACSTSSVHSFCFYVSTHSVDGAEVYLFWGCPSTSVCITCLPVHARWCPGEGILRRLAINFYFFLLRHMYVIDLPLWTIQLNVFGLFCYSVSPSTGMIWESVWITKWRMTWNEVLDDKKLNQWIPLVKLVPNISESTVVSSDIFNMWWDLFVKTPYIFTNLLMNMTEL